MYCTVVALEPHKQVSKPCHLSSGFVLIVHIDTCMEKEKMLLKMKHSTTHHINSTTIRRLDLQNCSSNKTQVQYNKINTQGSLANYRAYVQYKVELEEDQDELRKPIHII